MPKGNLVLLRRSLSKQKAGRLACYMHLRLGSRFHVSRFVLGHGAVQVSFTFTFDVHVATSNVTMGIGSDVRIQTETAQTV